jgi:hypothetical protein
MSAERMRHHLAEMERWQAECDRISRLLRAEASQTETGQMLKWKTEQLAGRDEWYRRASGHRNGHQQAALTYGIAALVDALTTPTPVLHGRVPGVVTAPGSGLPSDPGHKLREAA